MHVHVQVNGRLATELEKTTEITGLSRAAVMRLALSEYLTRKSTGPAAAVAIDREMNPGA